MGGQCYLFGTVSMSREGFETLVRDAEADGCHWISDAIACESLYFDEEGGAAVLDGVYVSWDSEWMVDNVARHKDRSTIDTLEWSGEGLDGPLSDVIFYFIAPHRWVVKEPKPPRLTAREKQWLLGQSQLPPRSSRMRP